MGKEELKDWFERNKFSFSLGFQQTKICGEKCKMFNEKECNIKSFVFQNFQNMNYTTCTMEQTITNDKGEQFRADLLLESSDENVKPLLIEVCIKHPCEKKKTNSGLQIIEIWFKSEEDIEKFCEKGEFKESESVRFYNIENTPKRKIRSKEILGSKKVMRFIYRANGTWNIYEELLPCSQMHTKIDKNSEIELNYLEPLFPGGCEDNCTVFLHKEGYDVKYCNYCKFYLKNKDNLECQRNFKFGHPEIAIKCSSYEKDEMSSYYKYNKDLLIVVEEDSQKRKKLKQKAPCSSTYLGKVFVYIDKDNYYVTKEPIYYDGKNKIDPSSKYELPFPFIQSTPEKWYIEEGLKFVKIREPQKRK